MGSHSHLSGSPLSDEECPHKWGDSPHMKTSHIWGGDSPQMGRLDSPCMGTLPCIGRLPRCWTFPFTVGKQQQGFYQQVVWPPMALTWRCQWAHSI
jgi:hypothetical protein